MKKSLSKKQIPTLLGIGVLVLSLIAGVFFIGKGGGVFAPRATAQTSPKKVKNTDLKDMSFTVSFVTDEATAGFVNYGTTANTLNLRASDDRDQLSGSIGQFTTHYITIRDLNPDTQYFFTVGTGSVARYDKNGQPFTLHTTKKLGTLPSARTAYGTITTSTGNPAVGSIVYITSDGIGEVSALVKDSGSWAVPLSNARSIDGTAYAVLTDTTPLNIMVQGPDATTVSTLTITAKESQPTKAIVLTTGSGTLATSQSISSSSTPSPTSTPVVATVPSVIPSTSVIPSPTIIPSPSPTPVPSASPIVAALVVASPSPYIPSFPVPATSQATSLIPTSPFASTQPSVEPISSGSPLSNSAAVVTVGSTDKQIVQTTTPTIVGQAPPNVQVSIIIHSTTLINSQTQTDANGNYVFDVASASKNLEPGKHTVTISYKDPQTGKIMTKTQTFVVSAPSPSPSSTSTVIALAAPYGSTNPYPVASPDVTPIDSPVPSFTLVSTPTVITKTISSSGSALPVSGHTSATFFLIFGGLFFILAGVGSFFVSHRRTDD